MQGRWFLLIYCFIACYCLAQNPCQIHIFNRTHTTVTFITSDDRLIGSSDANHPWVEARHLCLEEKAIIALTQEGHAVSKLHYWVTPYREALLTYPDSFHTPQ